MAAPRPVVVANGIINSIYYQDRNRVTADVGDLLAYIRTLEPQKMPFTHNTGATVDLLTLHGTIPISYMSNVYHIPVRVWIQEAYPRTPPLVFVEPTRDMEVKRDHGAVAPDGACDNSFWNPSSMKLMQLIQELQRRFGADPPVYAKPPRTAATADRRGLVDKITRKTQDKMTAFFSTTRKEIDAEFSLQGRLAANKKTIDEGVEKMRGTMSAWESHNEALGIKIAEVESWVASQVESAADPDPDELVQPPDALSRQLMDVTCEAAACEDALYYLDKALGNRAIDLPSFIREAERLARRQFMAKALAIKICNAQRTAGYGLAGAGGGPSHAPGAMPGWGRK